MADTLSDHAEVLFRQVHPDFVQNGRPSSQPFAPTPKDKGKLSVDRSAVATPERSYEYYTTEQGLASAGVCGLTVGEFAHENIKCAADPVSETNGIRANAAHAYADYNSRLKAQYKTIAKRLKHAAITRGWLYEPPL